jgi:hypothetical protein
VSDESEPALASKCSAALECGDLTTARLLAEQGLSVAKSGAKAKWIRRFEHLLRVATQTPIKGPPARPSACSFCHRDSGVSLSAGKFALICDNCVESCARGRWEGTVVEAGIGGDIRCGICGLTNVATPKFGANGFFVCATCAAWYWEEVIGSERRP